MNPIITAMIKASGRSFWQARYSDGKILSEWDTITGKALSLSGNGSSSRWEEAPKSGMVGLRLLCPNGMAAELEAPEGYHFFQFKVGGLEVTARLGSSIFDIIQKGKRFQEAHIIGVVEDMEGNCLCRAWETVIEVDEKGKTTMTVPPGTNWLIDSTRKWEKNMLAGKTIHIAGQLQYQTRTIWECLGDKLTIRGVWDTYLPDKRDYTITSLHKRLIQFEDNIFNMKYRNIGMLSIDVQQVKI